jgi:hypothetical protein
MMPTVSIRKLDDTSFEVTVQGGISTTHIVTVQPQYAARLCSGEASVERLISRSFDFLLAREQNTSILRRFDLPVIGQYFPEYEHEIIKMLE